MVAKFDYVELRPARDFSWYPSRKRGHSESKTHETDVEDSKYSDTDGDAVEGEIPDSQDCLEHESDSERGATRKGKKKKRCSSKKKRRYVRGYSSNLNATVAEPPVVHAGRFSCGQSLHVSKSEGNFPWPRASHCDILAAFSMEYHHFLCNNSSTVIACFVCHLCQVVVRPQDFVRHLAMEIHKPNGINSRFSVIERHRQVIYEHVLQSHGVVKGISFPPFPVVMDRPIPGLETYPGFVCAEPNCMWGCRRTQKGRGINYDAPKGHFKKKHNVITFSQTLLISCFIMTPYHKVDPKDPDFSIVIRLPSNWTLPTPPSNTGFQIPLCSVATEVAPAASFLEDLGWLSELEMLNVSVETVCLIVSSPRLQQLGRFSGEEAHLYRAFLVLYKLLIGYLLDGNRFAFSQAPEVATALTAGTNAKLRKLKESTLVVYSRTMMKCLSLLLWCIHVVRHHGKTHEESSADTKRVFNTVQSLQMILQSASVAQKGAAVALYTYLFSPHSCDPKITLQLLHNLLVSLVKQPLNSGLRWACLTDYSLFLGSLLPEGVFQNANNLTKECAALQHTFFIILLHDARSGGKNTFTPFQSEHWRNDFLEHVVDLSGAGCVEDAPEAHESRETTDEIEQEVSADAPQMANDLGDQTVDHLRDKETGEDFSESSLMNLLMQPEFASAVEAEGNLVQLLKENAEWVRPRAADHADGHATPFTHMKSVWLTAWPTAKREHRHSGFSLSANGIEVHTTAGIQTLTFPCLATLAHDAITQAVTSVMKALPHSTHVVFEDFVWTQLEDSLFEFDSIFLQTKNRTFLAPMIDTIYNIIRQSICRAGPPSNTNLAVMSWLKQDETILSSLCCAVMLTCGVPPRDFQLAKLQYHHDSKTGETRNVYIVDGSLCLANPKAKQRDKARQECLWALPSSLAKLVTFYLGVLRPVIMAIMQDVKLPAPFHATHIFVHSIPRNLESETNIHLWGGSSVNIAISKWTAQSPVRLDSRFLRDALTLVLKTFVPHLYQPDDTLPDLIDLQGQHTKATSAVHYGRNFQIPPSLEMTTERATLYISASKSLHWIYGIGSPSAKTLEVLESHISFSARKNILPALETARRLVILHYQVGRQSTLDANQATVDDILKHQPYFGDDVLIQVLKVLRHGFAPPPPLYVPPPMGCSAADSGLAVRLIVQALEEWRNGTFCQISDNDIGAVRHFSIIQTKATSDFEGLIKDKEKWAQLSALVHESSLSAPGAFGVAVGGWKVRGVSN